MRSLHARLVDEATRRDPAFTPRPFTAKALTSLGTIPDDYRAFLLEVGRLAGPLTIGHPGDFDMTELPEDFLPFGEDADHVYAFGDVIDRMARAEELQALVVETRGKKARMELEREIEQLRGDHVIETGIGTFDKDSGEITRSNETFTDWLERMMWRPEPLPIAPSKKKEAASSSSGEDVARALDLIDVLVAAQKLEVDDSFDESACAKELAKCLDDPERIAEILVDAPGVVELYATEHEIENALSRD